MVRLKIGDVFAIDTPNGEAYFQFVLIDEEMGELIRVLPGTYDQQPHSFADIVNGAEAYFVHFPVKAAKRQKIINLITNFGLPKELEVPKKFRTEITDSEGDLIGWHIINYATWQRETINELSEELIKLSPWGNWNDTLLVERITQEWNLENCR